MTNPSCCYISAFFDIERGNWNNFKRTFDEYLSSFQPYFKLFKSDICYNDEMILFDLQKQH